MKKATDYRVSLFLFTPPPVCLSSFHFITSKITHLSLHLSICPFRALHSVLCFFLPLRWPSGGQMDRWSDSAHARLSWWRWTRLEQTESWLGKAKARLDERVTKLTFIWTRLPTEEWVELVLMAVTLAAAKCLGAIHHCLKPTGHVNIHHLITSDEIMFLCDRDVHRYNL